VGRKDEIQQSGCSLGLRWNGHNIRSNSRCQRTPTRSRHRHLDITDCTITITRNGRQQCVQEFFGSDRNKCLCLYNSALWLSHKVTTLRKFMACYIVLSVLGVCVTLDWIAKCQHSSLLYNYNYRFYNITSVPSNCLVRLVRVYNHVTVWDVCMIVCVCVDR